MGGGGGGGTSSPSNNNNSGGGGGGYNPPPKPRAKPKPKPRPKPKPKPKPKTPAQQGPKPGSNTQFVDTGGATIAGSSPTMQGPAASGDAGFVGGSGQQQFFDKNVTKFVPGEGEGATTDAVSAALGADPLQQFIGRSPFGRGARMRGRGYLGQRLATTQEVPGLDSTVEAQEMAPDVGGGEIGVGEQGFGSRAMIGGEAELVQAIADGVQQLDVPAEVMVQSDVQADPNYSQPMPGKAYINDASFALPMLARDASFAFRPGTRQAIERALGPISRGLMSARSGFGRRFF